MGVQEPSPLFPPNTPEMDSRLGEWGAERGGETASSYGMGPDVLWSKNLVV